MLKRVTRARDPKSSFISRATKRLWLLSNFIRERFEARTWETRVAGPALEIEKLI